MVNEILYDTPDFDSGSNLNQLIKCILEFQSRRQNDDSLKIQKDYTANDFISIVDNLEEYYFEKMSYLTKLAPSKHQYLWMLSLESLAVSLFKFKTFYYETLLNDSGLNRDDLNSTKHTLSTIATKLDRVASFFKDLVDKFSLEEDVSIGKFLFPGTYSSIIKNKLFNFITTSFKLLTIDDSESFMYINDNGPALKSISELLLQYYEHVDKFEEAAKQGLKNDAFPTLTEFIKTAYVMGESQLIAPFLVSKDGCSSIINPKTPLNVIQTSAVDFMFLINYYKFTAFNLLTLSLSNDNFIEEKYNIQSDIYFKVLLNFPNLSTSVYERFEKSNNQSENILDSSQQLNLQLQERFQSGNVESSSISLLERQEISLLFILNYLLQLSELRNLIEPERYYKSELAFLIKSLSTSISQDIHLSASRSGSLHSSTAPSYSHLSTLENIKLHKKTNIRFECLSSIILQGSYKEKLATVIYFCEKLNQKSLNIPSIIEFFSLDSNSENYFQHLVSMIDMEKYPGKLVYAKTIGKIVRLLKMIGIKHLVQFTVLNNIPESYLNRLFCSKEPLAISAQVKGLVDFTEYIDNDSKENIIRFKNPNINAKIDLDYSIKSQIENFKTTKDLERLSSNLK